MYKNTPWYLLLRRTVVKPALFFFYKKIHVVGLEHLPKDKPVLLVPNHQNSFIDALLITAKIKPIIHYLARAKAFQPKVTGALLKSFNMLPVFRVRDGFSNIQKNNEIFEQCLSYLADGHIVMIFAEANHNPKRRLRPFSKGFTRIAFDAEIHHNWQFDMYVQPVGLNYSDHNDSQNYVSLVFGEPIPVAQYKELYEQDEHKAATALKNQTFNTLKNLIMHIPKLDTYNVYGIILDELEPDREILVNPEVMNRRVKLLSQKIPVDDELTAKADFLIETAEKYGLSIRTAAGLNKPPRQLYLFFPIYLLAFLNNLIPYQPVKKVLREVVKDHTFDASIKLLIGILVFPLYYTVVAAIIGMAIGSWPAFFLYIILSLGTCHLFKPVKDIFEAKRQQKKRIRLAVENPEVSQSFGKILEEFKTIRASVFPGE